MTPKNQRIAIAEACGWKRWEPKDPTKSVSVWIKAIDIEKFDNLPDYLNDLNAAHEMEQVLLEDANSCLEYCVWLEDNIDTEAIFSTATQRAEAFLKTLGIWKEEPVSAASVEGLR